jgi:hypothetical protein
MRFTSGQKMTIVQALTDFKAKLERDSDTVKHDEEHIEEVAELIALFDDNTEE